MQRISLSLLFFLLLINVNAQPVKNNGRLRVTSDGHYLEYENGKPFFWLGDTGWQLFSRLTLPEIKMYLENRATKGFNVIQVCLLGEDKLGKPNRYGHRPLINNDPLQPNEKYFALVDSVVRLCFQKNMMLALLPAWGSKVVRAPGNTVIFDSVIAYRFGKWLATRYKKFPNIIWMMGGDVAAVRDSVSYVPVWRNMAKGIREATNNKCLITYHPSGYRSSSQWVHQESWLNFNMIQTSHGRHDAPVWEFIRKDRSLLPVKPSLDGEPNYEDHPVNPWPKWNADSGYFRAYDVRKQLYRGVFAGGLGITYGHHSVWQFMSEREEVINYADRGWVNALDRPGAFQAGYLRKLVESRPMKERIPDNSLVIKGQNEINALHIEACRGAQNSYAMIYMPVGKTITIDGSFIKTEKLIAWWFNPRDAVATKIGLLTRTAEMEFTPPTTGIENDWVLVLDDPAEKFNPPGK
ncbi:MAG: glycoside hydrolase family 140 protein [Chitinophagaceae bacterium]